MFENEGAFQVHCIKDQQQHYDYASHIGTKNSDEMKWKIDGAYFMFLFCFFLVAEHCYLRYVGVWNRGFGSLLDQKVQVSIAK